VKNGAIDSSLESVSKIKTKSDMNENKGDATMMNGRLPDSPSDFLKAFVHFRLSLA